MEKVYKISNVCGPKHDLVSATGDLGMGEQDGDGLRVQTDPTTRSSELTILYTELIL